MAGCGDCERFDWVHRSRGPISRQFLCSDASLGPPSSSFSIATKYCVIAKANLLPRLFESIGMLDKGARDCRTGGLKRRYSG